MSTSALLTQGLQLMLLGMGFVFVFLGALVVMVSLISQALTRLFPQASPAATVADAELIAVITAAVHRFRKGQGGQQRK